VAGLAVDEGLSQRLCICLQCIHVVTEHNNLAAAAGFKQQQQQQGLSSRISSGLELGREEQVEAAALQDRLLSCAGGWLTAA
jgi:hypothetical protein